MQVVYALDMGERYVGFTHYDLHTQNVLVREITKPVQIEYEFLGKKLYLKTVCGISTIIDYGRSRITYNDKPYGAVLNQEWGSDYRDSFPLSDIFKLLVDIAYIAKSKQKTELYPMLNTLFKFFINYEPYNDENTFLENDIDSVFDVGFFLPKNIATDVNIEDFISYVHENIGLPFVRSVPFDDVSILNCNDIACPSKTKSGVLGVNGNLPLKPHNIPQMYDILTTWDANDKEMYTYDFVRYDKAKSEYMHEIHHIYDLFLDNIDIYNKHHPNKMKFASVAKEDPLAFVEKNYFNDFKDFYTSANLILSLYKRLIIMDIVLDTVMIHVNDDDLAEYTDIFNEIYDYDALVEEVGQQTNDLTKVGYSLYSNKKFTSLVSSDDDNLGLKWYKYMFAK